MANADEQRFISPISVAHSAFGLLHLKHPFAEWRTLSLGHVRAATTPLTHEIAAEAYNLRGHFHKDPYRPRASGHGQNRKANVDDSGRFDSQISARKGAMRDYLTGIHKNVRSMPAASKLGIGGLPDHEISWCLGLSARVVIPSGVEESLAVRESFEDWAYLQRRTVAP